MDTGSIIRRIRKDKGLTLEQLALEVGADAANLSRFETGKQNASPAMLKKISLALDFPLSQMYLLLEQKHSKYEVTRKTPKTKLITDRLDVLLSKFMQLDEHHQQLALELVNSLWKAQQQQNK